MLFFWFAGFCHWIFQYGGFEGLEMLWGMEDLRYVFGMQDLNFKKQCKKVVCGIEQHPQPLTPLIETYWNFFKLIKNLWKLNETYWKLIKLIGNFIKLIVNL